MQSLNRKQLTTALTQFYQRPVAQVSLELFLSIGAIIFFALFAIRPTLLTMSDLIKEINDKRELDQKLAQKYAALQSAQEEYLGLQSRLAVLDEAIPSQPNLVEVIKIVEKLASDRRLVIVNLSVSEIPPETPFVPQGDTLNRQNLALKVIVTGDYPLIKAFLDDIKNSRRAFLVESIVFSTGEERGVKKLNAIITIGVPYFGEKAGAES
ncbi:MAG TPA: type 4a pilus biogenesis protein PilO [Vitreimonas sp.]|nr:type 4a pilus biogenesis protein PilO [Vitreimonas sp.]